MHFYRMSFSGFSFLVALFYIFFFSLSVYILTYFFFCLSNSFPSWIKEFAVILLIRLRKYAAVHEVILFDRFFSKHSPYWFLKNREWEYTYLFRRFSRVHYFFTYFHYYLSYQFSAIGTMLISEHFSCSLLREN